MAGLHVSLLTLRNPPCGWPRIARGRSGSLLLDRTTLAFATPRRLTRRYSPLPAYAVTSACTLASAPANPASGDPSLRSKLVNGVQGQHRCTTQLARSALVPPSGECPWYVLANGAGAAGRLPRRHRRRGPGPAHEHAVGVRWQWRPPREVPTARQ